MSHNGDILKRIEKRKKLLRLILLKQVMDKVLGNDFNNIPVAPNDLLDSTYGGSRRQYLSPIDRSTYNYGFMNINEIGAGTPNIW